MFERTFSFWRRWVGRSESCSTAGAIAVAEGPDERRLWVRYPADLPTLVHRAAGHAQTRAAAKIRDISRGGANLLLDHEVQPGQLVNLELPSPDEEGGYTILACVVRSWQEPTGKWALGCVFSRELTDEDLLVFGARRVRHAPEDKRTWMRFDCNSLQANFQKIGDATSPSCSARVLNLSPSGIGLFVEDFIDAGALLNIDLVGKDGTTARTILACVVHVAQHAESEWALGCNFIRELSEEDFEALI